MKTYTILPAAILGKLEPELTERGIEYKCLYGPQIPENVPESCTFRGREHLDHLVCIESEVPEDKMHKIAEEAFYRELK